MIKHLFFVTLMFGCVVDPKGNIKKPTPTAGPSVSPKPSLTAIPPYPTASPEPTARPFVLTAPTQAEQCEKFKISIKGPKEKDDIVLWAEKQFHIGRLFYDASKDEKYLVVKLNTSGERYLNFTVNGIWEIEHKILIVPHPENCAFN